MCKETAAVKLSQDTHHTTGAGNILDMIAAVRGYFAKYGDLPGEGIDILHGEVHTSLPGYGKKMKYCIGRSAHGDIERHGIHECLFCGDGARQNALVIIHIVCKCIFHYKFSSL